MKFLVIGTSQSARDLAKALRQPNEVEQLQSVDDVTAWVRNAGEYDWVLVDDADLCVAQYAEKMLGELNSTAPISRVSAPAVQRATARKPMPICAVERTDEGMQILRCALRRAVHSADGDPALRAAVGERPLTFEYHAPMRKTG